MTFRNAILTGVATAMFSVAAVSAQANPADTITAGQWYTGTFGSGTQSTGSGATIGGQATINNPLTTLMFTGATGTNGPILPSGTAPAVPAPEGAWTITLGPGGGLLTITDAELSGDQFQLFDNGTPMTPASSILTPAGQLGQSNGYTSDPVIYSFNSDLGQVLTGIDCGSDISCALSSSFMSSGTFFIPQGVNVITGQVVALANGAAGEFNFIVEATPTRSVPEPASLAILGAGLAGVGLSRRRKKTV